MALTYQRNYETVKKAETIEILSKLFLQLGTLMPRLASFVKSLANSFSFYKKLAVTLAKKG